jgi:hypothetical protein
MAAVRIYESVKSGFDQFRQSSWHPLLSHPAGALHRLLGSRDLVYSWMILSLVVPYLMMDHLQSLEYHKIDPIVELPVRVKTNRMSVTRSEPQP